MNKRNCWEVKQCDRQNKISCPAAIDARLHGVHGGTAAGRACWVVAGTLCGGRVQGSFAAKYHNCEKCDFYNLVKQEEGAGYELSLMLLKRMRETGGSAR